MRSAGPWCSSHRTTAATSRERNCSWTAVSHRCRPSMAERHGTNSKHPRRRLAARRPVAAYGRTVQRCLLLILIASAPFLIVERPQSWDVLAAPGALPTFAAFLKFDPRSIFAIIVITSPRIHPSVDQLVRAVPPLDVPTLPSHQGALPALYTKGASDLA